METAALKTDRSGSAAAYLRAVAPSIPPELIDASCVDDIASVLDAVPGALSNYFLLECRLGERKAASDCSIMLSAANGGRAKVAGRMYGEVMPDYPGWAPIMAFLERWAQPESPFFHQFDHIWLEFDTSGEPGMREVPSLFFSPRDGGALGPGTGADGDRAVTARALIAEAVSLLGGDTLDPDDAARLVRCMERIPPGAFLFQVGVMCGRRPASLRLLLSHISPGDLIGFLAEIGWPGDVRKLLDDIRRIAARVDGICYGVEIHDGIGQRVGMECYIRDDDWRTAHQRWPDLIEYLMGQGLCLPEKGAALLAYPGITHENSGAGTWPANLASAGAFFRGGVVPVLARTIHHVKLSFADGGITEAKAYPGLSLGWVTRA